MLQGLCLVSSQRNLSKEILSLMCLSLFFVGVFSIFPQKMDKNRDGVVTIEEFIETCQKVTHTSHNNNNNSDVCMLSLELPGFPSGTESEIHLLQASGDK